MHAAAQILPTDGALSQAQQEPIMLCDGMMVANNPSSEAVTFTSLAYGTENSPLPLKVRLRSLARQGAAPCDACQPGVEPATSTLRVPAQHGG